MIEFDANGNLTLISKQSIIDAASAASSGFAQAAANSAQQASDSQAAASQSAEQAAQSLADIGNALSEAEASAIAAAAAAAAAASYQAKIEVATISALKALSVASFNDGDVAVVRGHGVANDGGGGMFYRVAASAVTDDNGLVIAPNAGAGRWHRLVDGNAISVRWFGARGNGVTDDRPAFLAAFTAAVTSGFTVRVPAGTYFISSIMNMDAVTFTHPLRVFGEGPGSVILGKGLIRVRKDSAGAFKTLAADVAANSRTIQLTDNTGVAAGHLLYFRTSNQANSANLVYDQLVQVRAVNGDGTLTITPVKFPFPVSLAFSAHTIVTTVTHFPVATDLHFERITFRSILTNAMDSNANVFQWIDQFVGRLSIIDCGHTATLEARDVSTDGMYYLPGICIARQVMGVRIHGGFYETTGYTFWFQWSGNAIVSNVVLRNQRHAFTTNNAHDVIVTDIISQGGGVLDSHGSWDVRASNIKSTGTPNLNNIRSNGSVVLKDSDLDGDVTLSGGASSGYLWDAFVANAADYAWFETNIRNRAYAHVENCVIQGQLNASAPVSEYRLRDLRVGSVGTLENAVNGTTRAVAAVYWENIRSLDGQILLYSASLSRGVSRNINAGNPMNHARVWFVPAASAASGRDTFIALIGTQAMNCGKTLMPFIADFAQLGRYVVGAGVTKQITVCFMFAGAGNAWPAIGGSNDKVSTDAAFQAGVYSQDYIEMHLNAFGAIFHANSTTIAGHNFRDTADLSKQGTFRDFAYNGDGYKVLTITAFRRAGSTAIPTDVQAQWPAATFNLRRYEIDVNVVVNRTSSTLCLSFAGHVHHVP
jgi:hypothetical protein